MVGTNAKHWKGYYNREALHMKQVYGIWFPESDTHFNERMIHPNGDYQRDTFQAAMSYVKEPKIFYDIGAHVGLWSLMAHRAGFRYVEAYEPNPKTFACLQKNFEGKDSVVWDKGFCISLRPHGISPLHKYVRIIEEDINNSGAIRVEESDVENSSGSILSINNRPMHDYIEHFNTKPYECLVKIDTEGMEADCVLGMDKILYALRPVVCVEQRSNQDALRILQQMGMEIVKQVRKDYILTWKNH